MSLTNALFDYIAILKHLDESESMLKRALSESSVVSH